MFHFSSLLTLLSILDQGHVKQLDAALRANPSWFLGWTVPQLFTGSNARLCWSPCGGLDWCFTILTVNPNFATAYFNAIAIATDYLGMDRTRLQEYYNSHTAILPQGIKDVLGPHFQQGISQFPGGLAFFFYSLILLILQEEGRTQGGREGKEGQDHVKQDATTSNHSCLATDFSFLYYLLYFVTDRSPIPHAAD